jgi:hypothetical protein
MALFALVLLFVTDRREHPGRLWAVPLIVIAWANVHGSFFLGPLVLGLAWLEDLHDRQHRPHRTLVVAVVSMVAAFLTPLGPAVWGYAVGLTMNPEVTRRITEWQPTSVRDVAGLLFFGSVLAVVVLIARREKSTPWPTLLWLGAFFFIGVYAARGIAWWPLGAVAGIAGVLIVGPTGAAERREPTGTPILRRLNAVIAVTISVAGLALLPLWRPIDSRLNTPPALVDHAPPGITAELRTITRPGDHLFNPQPWGSWFEFALPEVRVAIDSRIELFPVDVWNAYDQVAAGADGWAERLEAWGVTIFVVSAGNEALTNRLAKAGWHQEYSDEDGVILLAPGRL